MESKVQVMESSLVAPREATPTRGLWLSPLDQALANRGHTPLVYLYRSGAAAAAFDVARVKEAMARALVLFYPLAGRLGVDGTGRVEIRCNGEGALFILARSDLTAEDVDFSKPSPELRRMCVPDPVEPSSLILATQVTLFKCGGVTLGLAVHHAAVDAMSTFHFMQTWSAFSKDGDGAAVELPCHDRTLLRARSPPTVHPGALSMLCPKVTFSESSPPTATQAFTITGAQLAALKRLCGGASSTFCCVSAMVWRCATAARRLPPRAVARLSFPANVRRRVRPPLPARYFGNALIWLGAAAAARDVASEPLASVAGRVGAAVARMDDELVRSAVDHLELDEPDGRPLRGSMPETELRITSWLGMPVYDADFGGGSPAVMSRAESVRGGFVYVMDDGPADHRGGGGAVRVIMCMEAANIKEFERLMYANIANTTSTSTSKL